MSKCYRVATASMLCIPGTMAAQVIDASLFSGSDYTTRINNALSSCGRKSCTVGVPVMSSLAWGTGVVVPPNVTIKFYAGTYSAPGGPTPSPMFRTYTSTGGTINATIEGAGVGRTVLIVPAGAACTRTNRCNIIEVYDPTDEGKTTSCPSHITIRDLTLDGNKQGVAQPANGGSSDLAHSGLLSNCSNNLTLTDVEARNWWYGGIILGLYNSSFSIVNLATSANGYSTTVGYGGFVCGGICENGSVRNHVSNGDMIGAWLINNVYRLHYQGVIASPAAQGLVLGGNASSGNNQLLNTIEVVVTNAGSQSVSVGAQAGENTSRNVFTINSAGSAGAQDVYLGPGATLNQVHMLSSGASGVGLEVAGSNNLVWATVRNASQSGQGDNWAVQLDNGAKGNSISGRSEDDQRSSWTQRGVFALSGSQGNTVALGSSGPNSGTTKDLGTNNTFVITKADELMYSTDGDRESTVVPLEHRD